MEDSLYEDMIDNAAQDHQRENPDISNEELHRECAKLQKEQALLVATLTQMANENKRLVKDRDNFENEREEFDRIKNTMTKNVKLLVTACRREVKKLGSKIEYLTKKAFPDQEIASPEAPKEQRSVENDILEKIDFTQDVKYALLVCCIHASEVAERSQPNAAPTRKTPTRAFDCRPFNGPKTPPTPSGVEARNRSRHCEQTENCADEKRESSDRQDSSRDRRPLDTRYEQRNSNRPRQNDTAIFRSNMPKTEISRLVEELPAEEMMAYVAKYKSQFDSFRIAAQDWMSHVGSSQTRHRSEDDRRQKAYVNLSRDGERTQSMHPYERQRYERTAYAHAEDYKSSQTRNCYQRSERSFENSSQPYGSRCYNGRFFHPQNIQDKYVDIFGQPYSRVADIHGSQKNIDYYKQLWFRHDQELSKMSSLPKYDQQNARSHGDSYQRRSYDQQRRESSYDGYNRRNRYHESAEPGDFPRGDERRNFNERGQQRDYTGENRESRVSENSFKGSSVTRGQYRKVEHRQARSLSRQGHEFVDNYDTGKEDDEGEARKTLSSVVNSVVVLPNLTNQNADSPRNDKSDYVGDGNSSDQFSRVSSRSVTPIDGNDDGDVEGEVCEAKDSVQEQLEDNGNVSNDDECSEEEEDEESTLREQLLRDYETKRDEKPSEGEECVVEVAESELCEDETEQEMSVMSQISRCSDLGPPSPTSSLQGMTQRSGRSESPISVDRESVRVTEACPEVDVIEAEVETSGQRAEFLQVAEEQEGPESPAHESEDGEVCEEGEIVESGCEEKTRKEKKRRTKTRHRHTQEGRAHRKKGDAEKKRRSASTSRESRSKRRSEDEEERRDRPPVQSRLGRCQGRGARHQEPSYRSGKSSGLALSPRKRSAVDTRYQRVGSTSESFAKRRRCL